MSADRHHRHLPWVRAMFFHALVKEGRHPNTRHLIEKFGITGRTALRDLDFMRDDLKLPLEYDHVRRGFKYTRPVGQFPQLPISESELFAMLVASKVVAQYQGTPFAQPLAEALQKLTGLLDVSRELSLSHMQEAISFRPIGQEIADLEVFGLLSKALHARRQVTLRYRKGGDGSFQKRSLCPLHIACILNRWYLFAFDLVRNAQRTFAMDRIRSVRLTSRKIPAGITFDPAAQLHNSFGPTQGHDDHQVVIDFDAWAADLIGDRKWTPTQVIQRRAGGGIRMSMRLNSLVDVERWLLGYGRNATVVQPPQLARRLRQQALDIAAKYAAV